LDSECRQLAELRLERGLGFGLRGFKTLIRAGNGSFSRRNRSFETPQAEATIEALAQLQLVMGSATKRVRTPTGIKEEPDCRRS
jgi:hypothetical protein